jgi:hypothetical protein
LLNYPNNTNRSTGIRYAIIVQSFHDWAILLEIEAIELILEMIAVLWVDIADEVDVLI